MINAMNIEQIIADHSACVARVNRDGWMREVATHSAEQRESRFATVVSHMRDSVALTLIRVGRQLQGARHDGGPAAAI
jgi:hypothetical protein